MKIYILNNLSSLLGESRTQLFLSRKEVEREFIKVAREEYADAIRDSLLLEHDDNENIQLRKWDIWISSQAFDCCSDAYLTIDEYELGSVIARIPEEELFHLFEMFLNYLKDGEVNICNSEGKIRLNSEGDSLLITDRTKGRVIREIIKNDMNHVKADGLKA